MLTVDLAIVGAGPAGSAAALGALRAVPHARVVVVDRDEPPRDKCCGDGLGPGGVEVLERLGVRDQVLAGEEEIRRVTISTPTGSVVRGLAPRAGYVVPRRILDARLLRAARAQGAEFLRRRLRRLDQDADGVVLDGRVRARVLVGADGAYSTVRRLVGAGAQPRAHRAVAVRGYVTERACDHLEFRFLPEPWPAYLWAFRLGDGRANVGVCAFGTTVPVDGRWLRATLEAAFPRVEADSLLAHQLPLSTARPRPDHGRVLLAGDAAGLVNPITGEGIATALASGALAGAAAVVAPHRPGPAYRRALRRHLGRHLWHTRLAATAFTHPPRLDAAVVAARDDPRVFADVVELGLGTGRLTARLLLAAAATGTADVGARVE